MQKIKATIVFIFEMSIILVIILLAGRFPAIMKQAWDNMMKVDPAWYWVINIAAAFFVAFIVYCSAKRLRICHVLAIIVFVFVLLGVESFAWHRTESLELIKSTTILSGIHSIIATAVSAVIAFIIHVSGVDYGEE